MTAPCLTGADAHALIDALGVAAPSEERPVLTRLAPWLASATPAEWVAAGCPARRDDQGFIQVDLRSGLLAIDRSDHDARRTVLWMRWNHGGVEPWVTGQLVEVPRDAAGAPLTDEAGTWLNDDLYALRVRAGGLATWSVMVVDARTMETRVESPSGGEAWASPHLRPRPKGGWNLYADGSAREAGRVARVVDL